MNEKCEIRANILLRFHIQNIGKKSTLPLQTSQKALRKIDKKIFKNLSFSRNSLKHLIVEFQRKKLALYLFSFIFGIGNFVLFSSPSCLKPITVKTFKVAMPKTFCTLNRNAVYFKEVDGIIKLQTDFMFKYFRLMHE